MAQSKVRVAYVCTECGADQAKWVGQCPVCQAWNTLVEMKIKPPPSTQVANKRHSYDGSVAMQGKLEQLSEVSPEDYVRLPTGMHELDRVLGGGLVAGSVILLGGDPGIGKSTLLLQVSDMLSKDCSVLYVSGEESASQIGLRGKRLHISGRAISVLTETSVEAIILHAEHYTPAMMVIDSIQTLFSEELPSAPGSVTQVRECASQLVRFAKKQGIIIWLVGHVTKEGNLAGPRVLEHMVDTVLYFEGEQGSSFRLIRAVKNRFGAVNELGIFAMMDNGLREVANPSAIFLSRHDKAVPGSLIMVTQEGTRPLLVEVQALVDTSPLANPRRVALGMEQNRLAMLLAVLHRHGGVMLFDQDVYVNVVGGVRIQETAVDLAVIMAVLSSFRDRPLPLDLAVFGEIGLAGEIRPVPNGPNRLREAAKHGIGRAIVPKGNVPKSGIPGLEVTAVTSLAEALSALERL